jgi:uncharacterized membrane protein YbhN (UPF0104 family)
MASRTRHRLRNVLLVLGGALAVRALWAFPWSETAHAMVHARYPLLAAALVVNLFSLVAKGVAWSLLLRPFGRHRMRSAIETTFVGSAMNSISISVVGEAWRVQDLARREKLSAANVTSSLVWSRVVEAAGLVAVVLTASALVPLPGMLQKIVLGLGLATLTAAILARVGRGRPAPAWMPKHLAAWLKSLTAVGAPRRMILPFLLALLNWGIEWATFHFALLAVTPRVSLGASLVAMLATNLAGAARSTPANVGVFQVAIVAALVPFGVSPAHAVAAGVLLQALQVLPVLALAPVLLATRGGSNADRGAGAKHTDVASAA